MPTRRLIEAYCNDCKDVQQHVVRPDDPGSCACTVCDNSQNLVAPLGAA